MKKYKLGDKIKTHNRYGIVIGFFENEYIIKDLITTSYNCYEDFIKEYNLSKMNITGEYYWDSIKKHTKIEEVKILEDY